jgi:hypothetical protein
VLGEPVGVEQRAVDAVDAGVQLVGGYPLVVGLQGFQFDVQLARQRRGG